MSERIPDAADAEATIALPAPARTRRPYSHLLDRQAAPADLSALGGLNPLVEAANPVLAAVPQIRHALRHPDPGGLRARLREQIGTFERALRVAQVPPETLAAARSALCALLDDSVAAAPWGGAWGRQGLLAEVEGESATADRFFTLLEEAMAAPRQRRDLLELLYVCLALGFEGRYRSGEGGRQALGQIRARAYEALVAGAPPVPRELSERWRGAGIPLRRGSGALALWALARGRLLHVTRGASGRRLDAPRGSAERADDEPSTLRGRFEEALETLRKARWRGPGGERRTGSELPWYVLIGAPGSGKTTAVLNAGLRFPLGDPRSGNAFQGVGGTRNCDWWLTEEAVLLDTAGRYTTQDSDREADAAAWLGFLDLLAHHCARRPLNGLVVTLSIPDLVHWNEEELARYGDHVGERVRELYARLGVRLPVYVLVTKADLLAGFDEFFAGLDAEARAQVWGATFDLDARPEGPRGLVERFEEEASRLERRLYGMLPARLQEERDLQRRAAIYRFPQQFRATRPLVGAFLDAAFCTGWEAPPLVRGVYFASGTQEGSPIDRVLGTLARTFNLERKVQPPSLGSGKSLFLKRLLREVIFGEAGIVGADPARERRA